MEENNRMVSDDQSWWNRKCLEMTKNIEDDERLRDSERWKMIEDSVFTTEGDGK
jgi:hypothetical protein